MLGVAAITVTAAIALGGCAAADTDAGSTGSAASSGDFGDVAFQLSWIKNNQFAGEFMAQEQGYYDEAGFGEVTMTAGGSSATSAEAAVLGGQAIAADSADVMKLASAIEQGGTLKVIGATYQKNPFALISLDENPIATPEDLVGKTIAVSDGDTLVWDSFLAENDIDPSSVSTVPYNFDSSILTSGQADGLLTYTTAGANVLVENGYPASEWLLADYGLPLAGEVFIASDETIANDRDKLKAFMLATIKGWKWAVENPEDANHITNSTYAKEQNYDDAVQILAMNAQIPLIVTDETKANGLLTMSDQLIDENVEVINDAGIDIEADDMFDMSILEEIYKENPDLI